MDISTLLQCNIPPKEKIEQRTKTDTENSEKIYPQKIAQERWTFVISYSAI